MKKTVLLILTIIAILLLAFSAFLCFADNVKLSSMGLRMEEKISSLPYADSLRNHNALSFIKIFFDYDDLQAFIETFDAAEGFSFPMLLGSVILLSMSSVIGSIAFIAVAVLLLIAYFRRKTVFSLRASLLCAAAGSFLTVLSYTLSLVILQKIYVMASFKFSLISLYVVLAITGIYLAIVCIVSHFIKLADAAKLNITYAQVAYEEGGIKYSETLNQKKKMAAKVKKTKESPKADA